MATSAPVPTIIEVKTFINDTLKIDITQLNRVTINQEQLSTLIIGIKQRWYVTINKDKLTNEVIPSTNQLGKVITVLSLFELISKTIRGLI